MSILKSLLDEFAPAKSPVVTVDRPDQCSRCGCVDHWQTHGNSQWYCTQCDPSPTQSMVAHRSGTPTITSSVAYAVGQPSTVTANVCGNRIQFKSFSTRPICKCGSHMIVEHTWSDGVATHECASCSAGIDHHG